MASPTETGEFKPSYNCRKCKIVSFTIISFLYSNFLPNISSASSTSLFLSFQSFSTKRESLLHKKTVHDAEPEQGKFLCKICNKAFANHGNMYRHMKGHGDIRPHSCRICGKAFAQAANLNRHYSVHNGERPFSCTVCNKSFTQQGNLRRHELVHTGEKPFRCKRCGRMFSQRINLKKHVMLHQGYRPFTCEICNKSFLQLQNYKKHLQRHEEKGIKTEENDV